MANYFSLSAKRRIEKGTKLPNGVERVEPDQLLARLNEQRLFREALVRLRESSKNIPPMIGGSPPPDHDG
jgi:hypothetical protein